MSTTSFSVANVWFAASCCSVKSAVDDSFIDDAERYLTAAGGPLVL